MLYVTRISLSISDKKKGDILNFIAIPVKNSLPQYTTVEEKVHVVSHLFGVAIGICMVIFSLSKSSSRSELYAGMVFGISLILLYTASCLYHGIPMRYFGAKKIFQVIDHCSIFILIAGSSTPFVLCVLGTAAPQVGWFYTLFIWTIAAVGIVLLVIDLNRFKKLSILLYLVMGFSVTLKGGLLRAGIGDAGFALVIAGGVAYCIGLVLYCVRVRWTHAVFHVLCVAGSALHCICVYAYIF